MKFNKTISLLILSITISANSSENNNLDKPIASDNLLENSTSFTLDMSDLSNFEFYQVEKNVIRHQDNKKIIEVYSGAAGIRKYINDLEEKLLNLDLKNEDKSDFQTSQITNEIQLYEAKLDQMTLESSKTQSDSKALGEQVFSGNCYPHMAQTYNFYPGFWRFFLSVNSSYPLVPGPFPPGQPVNLHATAAMDVIGPGFAIYPSSTSTFVGNNIGSGSTSASTTTGYLGGGTGVIAIDWTATSAMSMPICFEYIVATGGIIY